MARKGGTVAGVGLSFGTGFDLISSTAFAKSLIRLGRLSSLSRTSANAPAARSAIFAATLPFCSVVIMVSASASARVAEVRQLLADGKAVVYFRHGATTWSGIDQPDWSQERQRLLSDLGVEQSKRIALLW